MKNFIFLTYLFLLSNNIFCQEKIESGDYGDNLKLAFDSQSNKITGYYGNYTGWDEITNLPRFSCIFYIEGYIIDKKVIIKTYYTNDETKNTIDGIIEIIDTEKIAISLSKEHAGCWNVEHFANEPLTFEIEKKWNWIAIKYIKVDKSYFHKTKSNDSKLKSYLIQSDIVFVEKTEKDWAFCTYIGKNKKITKGWLKTADLNK